PRPEEEYESIGRRALFLLLSADDSTNGARRLPLADDVTWNKMKTLGQPGFPTLFAPLAFNANQIADITSDYTPHQVVGHVHAPYGTSARANDRFFRHESRG